MSSDDFTGGEGIFWGSVATGILGLLAMIFLWHWGITRGKSIIHSEAVERGYGEMVVVGPGEFEFRWKGDSDRDSE